MILKTLIIIYGRLYCNLLADEERISNLNTRHHIVITTSMNQFHTSTEINTILF